MDTYKVVQLLQNKGYSKEEAEGFIEAIQEITLSGVATKQDINLLKEDLRKIEKNLNEKISETKIDLTKAIHLNTVAIIGILTAVISIAAAIIKL